MNDKTLHVLNRFSSQKDTLVRLMIDDSEFYQLCQDYEDCVNALQYWSTSKEPVSKARIDEYRTLVRELEEEILQAMKPVKQ